MQLHPDFDIRERLLKGIDKKWRGRQLVLQSLAGFLGGEDGITVRYSGLQNSTMH